MSATPDLGPRPDVPDAEREAWRWTMLLHRKRAERIVALEDRFGLGPKPMVAGGLALAAVEPLHVGLQVTNPSFEAFRFHVARLLGDPRVVAVAQLHHHAVH